MYLIINFKQNLNESSYTEYITSLNSFIKSKPLSLSLILCPSFPYLHLFSSRFKGFSNIFVGSQDVSKYSLGSHTGQVSADQISDYCQYSIVNHSETLISGKTDLIDLKEKIKNLETSKITPLICTKEYSKDFEEILKPNSLVCYEDPNHIGGTTANSTDDISKFYNNFENKPIFLYGGSVNPQNVPALLKLSFLSGLLVATAALTPAGLIDIIRKIETVKNEK